MDRIMNRVLIFRPERCLMCYSCVLACQLKAIGVEDPRDPDLKSGAKPPRRLSMVLTEAILPGALHQLHRGPAPRPASAGASSGTKRPRRFDIARKPAWDAGAAGPSVPSTPSRWMKPEIAW